MPSYRPVKNFLLCFFIFTVGLCWMGTACAEISIEDARASPKKHYWSMDYEGGVWTGKELLDQYPNDPELKAWVILNMMGKALGANFQDSASVMADEFLETYPNNGWSYFAKASVLNNKRTGTIVANGNNFKLGVSKEEALLFSEKAMGLLPQNIYVQWMHAQTLRIHGQRQNVSHFIDSLLTTHKSPPPLLLNAKADAMLRPPGRRRPYATENEGIRILEKVLKEDSDNVYALFKLGRYLNSTPRLNRQSEGSHYLKRAAKVSPFSAEIQQYYWGDIQDAKNGIPEEKRAQIDTHIQDFLQRRSPYPGTLLIAFRKYVDIGMQDRWEAIGSRILADFPNSWAADWVLVEKYTQYAKEYLNHKENYEKDETYRNMIRSFIKRPKHFDPSALSVAYGDLFNSLKSDESTDLKELNWAIQGIATYEEPLANFSNGFYAESALLLAKHANYYGEAENLAQEGINQARAFFKNVRDPDLTPAEQDKELYRSALREFDALAWVYLKMGNYDLANDILQNVHEQKPDDALILYHLGKLHEAKEDYELAGKFYLKSLMGEMPGTRNNPSEAALRKLYVSKPTQGESYETYVEDLFNQTANERKMRILATRRTNPKDVPSFKLMDLNNKQVTFEKLKGKILVINFWGIWCGPCVSEMPDFQDLHTKYENHPQVEVLSINNDKMTDIVLPWMKKRDFTFPVLFDDGYVKNSGVRSFPTTWFVNQDGKIVYRKTGFTKRLVEEFSWIVDDLADR